MPLIELHLGAPGNRGDDAGNRMHPPHGGDAAVGDGAVADRERRPRRGRERVLAQPHRRGPGVRRLTGESHEVPLDADGAAHGTRQPTAVEQYRPLLDVELEIRDGSAQPFRGGRRLIEIDPADRQRVAQRHALRVSQVADLVRVERPGARRGAEQTAAEPRALLVRPVDEPHSDRRRRAGAGQLPHRLERGQQPERPVKPAAVGNRVDVRSDDHEALLGTVDAAPQVPGLVTLRLEADVDELRGEPRPRLEPLGRPGKSFRPREPPAALGCELVEVGDDRLRVEPELGHAATSTEAPSDRGTKRPWPGSVLISPRSYTSVPRENVCRTLALAVSPS